MATKAFQPPEYFTESWYANLKRQGLTDAEIAKKKLYVSLPVLARWKREIGITKWQYTFSPSGAPVRDKYKHLLPVLEKNGISYQTFLSRIYYGWSDERASTERVTKARRKKG